MAPHPASPQPPDKGAHFYDESSIESRGSGRASGELEELAVTKNMFTGDIPCPSHNEPMLKSLYLARNAFSGELPTCLFTSLPRLQSLDISYLQLSNAHIPFEFANIGHSFVNLFAEHAGLTGPLPASLACMRNVIYFHLGRNDITEIPQ